MNQAEYDKYQRDQEAKEQANDLLSAAKSSDGRVFGIKVPEPLPTIWEVFGGRAMQFAGDHGGDLAGKAVKAATHSEAAGNVAQAVVGYGTTYIPQGIQGVVIRRNHNENRKLVLEPIAPLIAANKTSASSGGIMASLKGHFNSGHDGNKMVDFALGKVTEDTYQNLKGLAVDSMTSVVNNVNTYLGNIENQTDKQAKTYDFMTKYGNDIAGVARTGIKKSIRNVNIHEALPETSLGKVVALQEMIRQNNWDSPSSVASSGAIESVATGVEDIFQTYQKEQKLRPIPSHRMRDASKQIAEELISGDLHALSLVNLIGKEKLLNDKKDGLVSSEKIADVIKAETAVFSKTTAITSEDFLREHATFTLDDIKAHLQSKDKDERALLAVLVPEPVLLEAGMKKEEVKALTQHFTGKMQEGVFTAIIKGLAAQSDEQLEDKGFSREAVVFVRDHEGPGAESIAHTMQNKAGLQQLKNVSVDALMGEESTAWQDAITAGRATAAKDGPHGAWAEKKVQKLVADASKGPRSPTDFAEREHGALTK